MKRTNKPVDGTDWILIALAVACMIGLMLMGLWGVVESVK